MIDRVHIDRYLKAAALDLSPASLRKATGDLEIFWSWAKNRTGEYDYSRKLVADFVSAMRNREYGEVSIFNFIKTVRSLFAWLVTNDIIETNPLIGVKPVIRLPPRKKEQQVFTSQEYERLKAEARANLEKPYWYGALLIAWNTGLRISDVAQLKWSQVNLLSNSIRLIPQKQRRQRKPIEIPMTPELKDWLHAQRSVVPGEKEYVQPLMAGSYLLDGGQCYTLSSEFRWLCVRAKIPKFKSFHTLRRSFCTRAISAGITPAMVSQITGQSLQTIMLYVSVPLETKRSEMEKMQSL